ncbi:MAG: nucleoside phosphorylase [Planctomycetota bacterium]
MLLRFIVNQWINQTARQKVYELVGAALRGQGGASSSHGTTRTTAGERSPAAATSEDVNSSGEPSAASTAPSPAPIACDVALVFALDLEAGGLVDRLERPTTARCARCFEHAGWLQGRRIVIAEAGVGQTAAEQATEDLLALYQPQWLISAGFAGALRPEIRRGHLVMATQIADEMGHELSTGVKLPSTPQPGVHGGRLLTVDRLVRDAAERRLLAERYDAVACDMESLAVARVCQRQRTRFLSVRIISDAVEDELPAEVQRLLDHKSLAGKLGAAASAIWNRPSSAKDFWRLHREALQASERLAQSLTAILASLSLSKSE